MSFCRRRRFWIFWRFLWNWFGTDCGLPWSSLSVFRLVCLPVYTTRSQIEEIEGERSLIRCRAEVSSASWHSFTHPVWDTIVEDVGRVQTTQLRSEGTTASKVWWRNSYRRDVSDRWRYSILTSEFASAQSEMKISDLIQTIWDVFELEKDMLFDYIVWKVLESGISVFAFTKTWRSKIHYKISHAK